MLPKEKCRYLTSNKPFNLKWWLACKMYYCNSGTKPLKRVTKEYLIGFKTHFMRCNFFLILLGCPRAWDKSGQGFGGNQTPLFSSKETQQLNNSLWYAAILIDKCLSQQLSEKLLSAVDRNRLRDPQADNVKRVRDLWPLSPNVDVSIEFLPSEFKKLCRRWSR